MAVFWSLVWLCCSMAVLVACIKWQLPKLTQLSEAVPIHPNPDIEPNASCDADIAVQSVSADSTRRWKLSAAFLCCGLLACLCGYRASQCAESVLSILKLLLVFCVLECTAATDMKSMRIPNFYTIILLTGRVLFLVPELIFTYEGILSRLISSVVGGVCCFLFLLLMCKISRGGLGYGDVKLFSGLGFMCGFYAGVYTLLFSCVFCAIVSAVLLALRKKTKRDSLPMGPFILAGYGMTILLAAY